MGAQNLWDSIEVEMTAEFDSVKITLGDLKAIEEGAVVDLTSIYGNKVTLLVEDKAIAKGELVIVNDRYGVKVDSVVAKKGEEAQAVAGNNFVDDEFEDEFDEAPASVESQAVGNPANGAEGNGEDEFDYSDFELDDEDI